MEKALFARSLLVGSGDFSVPLWCQGKTVFLWHYPEIFLAHGERSGMRRASGSQTAFDSAQFERQNRVSLAITESGFEVVAWELHEKVKQGWSPVHKREKNKKSWTDDRTPTPRKPIQTQKKARQQKTYNELQYSLNDLKVRKVTRKYFFCFTRQVTTYSDLALWFGGLL